MKIQYCSDLHLEFPENKNYLQKHPIQPGGELLLLAGDVLPFELNHRKYAFFDFVADHFEAVYWIPGNHEYYGYDLGKQQDTTFEKIRSNVFLVNNHTVTYKDINIICSTLWSLISPVNEWAIQKGLSDFYAIKMNDGLFLPSHFNTLHQTALGYIKEALNLHSTSKNIVLTHHVPTFQHYPSAYKKSILNEAFAVELHDYIQTCTASHWIYGHHHSNTPAFKIGSTAMLTNQLGYIRKYEHGSYQKKAIFEI